MIYCCIRTVNVVIAVELCPPAHVDIFQVGKMQLVKEADLIKHSTAVNGRSGTGAEDPAGLLVKVYRTAHTSLIRPAQDTVHVSGIVQKLRMIHLDHPAADGKDALRLTDRTHHLRHEILVHPDVII